MNALRALLALCTITACALALRGTAHACPPSLPLDRYETEFDLTDPARAILREAWADERSVDSLDSMPPSTPRGEQLPARSDFEYAHQPRLLDAFLATGALQHEGEWTEARRAFPSSDFFTHYRARATRLTAPTRYGWGFTVIGLFDPWLRVARQHVDLAHFVRVRAPLPHLPCVPLPDGASRCDLTPSNSPTIALPRVAHALAYDLAPAVLAVLAALAVLAVTARRLRDRLAPTHPGDIALSLPPADAPALPYRVAPTRHPVRLPLTPADRACYLRRTRAAFVVFALCTASTAYALHGTSPVPIAMALIPVVLVHTLLGVSFLWSPSRRWELLFISVFTAGLLAAVRDLAYFLAGLIPLLLGLPVLAAVTESFCPVRRPTRPA